MPRLIWDTVGTRFFETGVDQGVLYLANDSGIPWSGLVSVSESPSGGEARPFYFDGQKYLNLSAAEEYEATINAFSSPPEFAPFDGVGSIQNGLFTTQQPRQAFGFSYRSRVGDDVTGVESGYKIHLVYNALSAPSERGYNTMANSTEPITLSWAVTTIPETITGKKPSAHLVIDSRYTPKNLLKAIEDIVYGSVASPSRLPAVSELVSMFTSTGPLTRQNLVWNPSFRATVPAAAEWRRNLVPNSSFELDLVGWSPWAGTGGVQAASRVTSGGLFGVAFLRSTFTTVPTTGGGFPSPILTLVANGEYVASAYIRPSVQLAIAPQVQWYSSGTPTTTSLTNATVITCPANVWTRVSMRGTVPAGSNQGQFRWYISGAGITAINQTLDIDGVIVEQGAQVLPYFDGSTTASEGLTYAWTGTAHASAAVANGQLEIKRNFCSNPHPLTLTGYSLGAAGTVVTAPWDATRKAIQVTCPGSVTFYMFSATTSILAGGTPLFPGVVYTVSAMIQIPAGKYWSARVHGRTGNFYYGAQTYTLSDGNPVRVSATATLTRDEPDLDIAVLVFDNNTGGTLAAGTICYIGDVLIDRWPSVRSYFDGATSAADGLTYAWTGTANASQSIATGIRLGNWSNGAAGVHPFYKTGTDDGSGSGFLGELRDTNIAYYTPNSVGVVGEYYAARALIGPTPDTPAGSTFRMIIHDGSGYVTSTIQGSNDPGQVVIPNQMTEVIAYSRTPLTGTQPRVYIYPGNASSPLRVGQVIMEKVAGPDLPPGTYFDGSSPDVNNNWYSWESAADASISDLNTWN